MDLFKLDKNLIRYWHIQRINTVVSESEGIIIGKRDHNLKRCTNEHEAQIYLRERVEQKLKEGYITDVNKLKTKRNLKLEEIPLHLPKRRQLKQENKIRKLYEQNNLIVQPKTKNREIIRTDKRGTPFIISNNNELKTLELRGLPSNSVFEVTREPIHNTPVTLVDIYFYQEEPIYNLAFSKRYDLLKRLEKRKFVSILSNTLNIMSLDNCLSDREKFMFWASNGTIPFNFSKKKKTTIPCYEF